MEEAHAAAAAVRGVCAPLGFGEVGLLRIEHCLYEAFVNAVQHAYHGQPGHSVRVLARFTRARLRLLVCQRDTPLDPTLVAAVPAGFDDLPATLVLDEVALHGRGLRIIKASMASCEVLRDGDWHCLCMTQVLPGCQSPDPGGGA